MSRPPRRALYAELDRLCWGGRLPEARPGFTGWLRRQHRRDDGVGDLARDVRLDPEWPSRRRTLAAYRDYLAGRGACDGALDSLQRAWGECCRRDGPR